MKQMNILYLGNDLSSHGFNQTTIETLGDNLKRDFHVKKASSVKNPLLRFLHMIFMVVKFRKVDFLLIDTYSTSAFHFAWTSARLAYWFGLRYIPILHGGELPKRGIKSPRVLTKYLQRAYKVVCPSEYLTGEMKRFAKRDYAIIPNFIDLGKYLYTQERFTQDGRINLFWLRSFHKIYNPELAVEILKALKDKGYNCRLCMVGPEKDGSMKAVRELSERLGVTEYLEISGKLSREDWVKKAKDYDVFINTSDVDNTPVSVIEAMALGLPIVTSNVGGIPYLIENGKQGLLVSPRRVDMFLQAIESLVNDKAKCLEMSAAARRKAEALDWEIIREKWAVLIK